VRRSGKIQSCSLGGFVSGRRKREHILGPDRLPVSKKPGLCAERFKQTLRGLIFQVGESVEYFGTKALRIVTSECDLDLALRRPRLNNLRLTLACLSIGARLDREYNR
jgi:hypothetical protein